MGAQRCAPAAARETLEAGNEGKMLQPWLLDDLASSLTIPKSYGVVHQCGTMSKLFVHSEKTRKKYRWVSKYHFFLFSLMWKNFKHSWHFWYFEWFWPFQRLHPSMYCRCIPPLPCLQKHPNPPGCQADPKVKPGWVFERLARGLARQRPWMGLEPWLLWNMMLVSKNFFMTSHHKKQCQIWDDMVWKNLGWLLRKVHGSRYFLW